MKTHLAVANAVRKLDAAGIASAPRDCRILLAHALGVPVDRLSIERPEVLSPDEAQRFGGLVSRRAAGEPVSHLVGRRAFFGRDFIVTPDVLDPRPETETLVAAALEKPFRKVLDLGTGSGAILISLLAERPEARGVGTDMSAEAVLVAGENAAAIGVVDRLILPLSDWYDDVGGHYDLIVSNPPYVALVEMAGLEPELSHEPRMALTDEGDGLSCYRTICAGAPNHLTPGGWLMVEIGPSQGAAVAAMMREAGLHEVEIRPDLDGRDRVVMGQLSQ